MTTHGLLLAAGAGSRMGTPKALVHDADGTSWLQRSVHALREGGCSDVSVVLGAGAAAARELLTDLDVGVVVAEDWADGMGASLRAGLVSLTTQEPTPMAALVTLVDLPDVGPEVVRRILAEPVASTTLRRATYDARPGHPVLLGRDHWDAIADQVTGDQGARAYLSQHAVAAVPCSDLATGHDVDFR